VLHAARRKYRTQKIAKHSPSGHHRTTLSRYIFATKARIDNQKNFLNSNISRSPYNMVNFGLLAAEIGSVVWETSANFNRFRVLPSLMQGRRSPEVNQTLHDVWPSPGLAGTVYIHFWGLLHLRGFCQLQNSLCVQVLCSPILATLLHGTRVVGVSQTLRR